MPNNITTFGQTPYVDDFQTASDVGGKTPEEKNYLRILYKPGVSVQARELNQMQSMLQSQIDSLGRSTFEDGAAVVGGEKQFDDAIYAVDVSLSTNVFRTTDSEEAKKHYLDNITTLQYQRVDNGPSPDTTNYINATVLHYIELGGGSSGDVRFFVRYDNTIIESDGTEFKVFPVDATNIYYGGADTIQSILTESNRDPELTGVGIISDSPYQPLQNATNGPIGTQVANHQAIIAKVDSGIFFVKGEFVLNDEQEIYLVKPVYDYLANGKLAFKVNEQTITTDIDEALYDNAQGFPNYKAPGADRYAIDLELVFLSDGDAVNAGNDKDFVDNNSNVIALSTIDDGDGSFSFIEEIQDGKDRIKVSDVLGDNITNTLARRTEEESGDYAVEPFIIDVREYFNDINNSENRGLYTEEQIRDAGITVEQGDISGIASTGDVPIGASTPSSADVEKYGESRMSIGIEPSVAYVDGFRIEATERIDIPVPKARTTESAAVGAVVTAQLGSYIEGDVDNSPSGCIFGTPALGINIQQDTTGATAKVRGIEKVGSKFRLYIYNISGSFNSTSAITEADSPDNFKFLPSSGIIEPNISESFITLPYENISTVVSANSTFKLRELMNGEFDSTVGTGNELVIAYTGADDRIFTLEGGDNYLVQKGTGHSDAIIIPESATITNSGKTVTLTLPSGHGLSTGTIPVLVSYDVSGNVAATGPKTKTPSNGNSVPHGTKTFTAGTFDNTFDNGGLGKVDAIEIISAIETHDDPSSPADSPPDTIQNDITSDLELDNGQRDGIYKEARARYTGSLDLSASTVVVTFKYFVRGTSGSYYTKNSYTNTDYKDIPTYKDIRLSDVIDFRGDEIGNGGLTTFFDPNSVIQTQVNYYLNRIDVVVVNSIGEFNVIQGTPGLYPDQPAIPDNAMHLYTVNVPAYTFDIKDIENEYIDNRRYTMRDIGDLESRIKNIEYFNTLSLLEKDASSKQITDDTGIERFKNGIVVDSFLGHGTADTFDPGYSASIDKEEGLMRPAFGETNNRFVLQTLTDSNGDRPNGIHLDGMATLPFTEEVALIDQDKASMHMSVNPYAVAAWWGEMKLSPSSDQWKETSQRPDVLVNRENDTDVLRNIRNGLRAQGTIWGSWRTNWVGRFRWTRSNARRRFGSRRGRGRLFVGFRFGRSIRRGLRTTARVETVRTTVNNRVVDTSFVPFIRSRRVYFTGKLFRPNTKLHLYFDGVDISSYATKAPFVQFTDNQDTRSFLGQNETQIFSTLNASRQELITDDAGSIEGYFIIPNNSANKFRTGEREVKLNDSATGATASDSTTEASVNYSATGIIQHRQRTVVSTRRVILRREWVTRARNIRGRARRRWRDPLAQSFMIGEIEEGVFATSVDLYFQRKSNNVPVQIYVVTTDNGYPSQEIIPGSEITLLPKDVSISNDATAVTNFRFDSPIYLSPGVEYAIVVLSNDDNYRMWLSDIGKEDVTTGEMIVKNPYTGVMFKSQNASTWTADQNKDFKFKLNRANFTTQTKEWDFEILTSDDSPADIFHQAMLQSEEVNLPQTSIRYQLSLDNGNAGTYVDVTPGEEYYEGGTIENDSNGDGTIKLKATLTTSSNFVTPLLDLDRLGLAGVFNIVNAEDTLIDTNASPDLDTETNANHGTALARYITQEVSLANPADQITTFLEINRPISGSNVRVYIRTKTGEENITENAFTRVLPKNGNPIPVNGDRDEFEEVEFEALNLALFSSFQVKIVMVTDDKEYVPVVKSLRSIATT